MAPHDNEGSQQVDDLLERRFAWVFGMLAVILAGFVFWTGRDWRTALRSVEHSSKIPTEAYVKWGMWWAGAVNAGICGVLALTAKWWVGNSMRATALLIPVIRRREWGWVLVVLVIAGGLRWARMDLSFYNDEAHTFRTYIAGRFRQSDEGKMTWKPVRWVDTFWLDKVGNNLMPCSAFGRLSYEGWKKLTHAPDGAVGETAVRLPQWIAGMAALVVLWLAARRMLGGQASWVALVLMAFHPWAVRYSTEARAYGMLMLGVVLGFYFLQRAFEDGRWRWWLGLGLAEFLCVWSFSGVCFFLVVFNVGVLTRMVYIWRKQGGGTKVLRPIVGMLVGGMVTLQLMLPTLPQLTEAMKLHSLTGSMTTVWWMDVLGGLLWGTRGWDSDPANPFNLALARMLLSPRPEAWIGLTIEILLLATGFLSLAKRGGTARIAAIAGPAALVVSWVVMSTSGKYLHPWYVIYAIPGLMIGMAAGAVEVSRRFYAKYGRRNLGILLVSLIVLAWCVTDFKYAHRGKENVRGIAETVQRGQPGLFAAMLSDVNIYDPFVLPLKGAEELDPLVARARAEGLPLTVSVGHVGIADAASVLERLEKSGEFEPVATLWGLEEAQFTHYIFRLRQGSPIVVAP